MHDSLVHAPIANPRVIADIGCGPGDVSRYLAARFPGASVYGVDLCDLPGHNNPPENLSFICGDINRLLQGDTEPRLTPDRLDYVFARLLVCGMTDWPGYIKKVVRALRSGGWIEMHEWSYQVSENGVNVSDEWPWLQAEVSQGSKIKGIDLLCSQKLKGWMEDAGLVDIKEVRYRAPIGFWDLEEHPETRKMAEHLATWWPGVNWLMISSLECADNPEGIKEMRAQMLKDLEVARVAQRKYYEIVVCYGRKP
jgi:trans-aconitate methyltransferase